MAEWITPDWPAPPRVRAMQTLRTGGLSSAPWDSFNLGDHVGDDPERVAANRRLLRAALPAEPAWLMQVHGVATVDAKICQKMEAADASFTSSTGVVCAIMTADCLPVLFCDRAGTVVAAAHAGWRGLAAGVLEASIHAMAVAPSEILVWFGPAIGAQAFEVGDEVREVFLSDDAGAHVCFVPQGSGKWLADLYGLARRRLHRAGVDAIYGGGYCTASDPAQFFSYRRDGITGRMASLIWLADERV